MEHPYTELAPVYSSFCQTLIKYSHSLQNSYLLSQTSRRVLLAAGFRLNQIVSWFLSAMILYFPRSLKSLPRKLHQQRRTIHHAKIDWRKKPFLLNSSCYGQVSRISRLKLSWNRDVTVTDDVPRDVWKMLWPVFIFKITLSLLREADWYVLSKQRWGGRWGSLPVTVPLCQHF